MFINVNDMFQTPCVN